MAKAFTQEWLDEQCKLCLADKEFQAGATKLNRSFTVRGAAMPEHGITEPFTWGFKVPEMSQAFVGEAGVWDTDYVLEADYETWAKVNDGTEKMVPLLMNKKIMVPKGSISYIARFVPVVDRYWQLSRSHTDSYDGDLVKS